MKISQQYVITLMSIYEDPISFETKKIKNVKRASIFVYEFLDYKKLSEAIIVIYQSIEQNFLYKILYSYMALIKLENSLVAIICFLPFSCHWFFHQKIDYYQVRSELMVEHLKLSCGHDSNVIFSILFLSIRPKIKTDRYLCMKITRNGAFGILYRLVNFPA